ncbi:MAG: hypothetical protein EP329_15000 [Deltaproteobacteria bacterium]|nr:MAG: hypothetical protein EP329_15000 [Deltaproteobacteria bacterium]
MSKQGISRRAFFTTTATAVGVTAAAGAILGACGGKGSEDGPSCEPSGLSLADEKTRTMNKYVAVSTTEGKHCANCQLFKPGADPNACGNCTVIKGIVSPKGYCQLWAEKKA